MSDITIPPEVVKAAMSSFLYHQKEGTETKDAWADILRAAIAAWPGMNSAEVERLRAALKWYADKENWKRRIDPYEEGRAYPPKAILDNGSKARAALGGTHDKP